MEVLTQIRALPPTLAYSRRYLVTVVALGAASSTLAAYAQDAWRGWHFLGHSLVLWVIIAAVASLRGTLIQAWATCAAVLACSVFSYFISLGIFSPYAVPSIFGLLTAFWLLLAIVGAFGFAVLIRLALGASRLSWLAIGSLAGMLIGDGVNVSIGIPWIEQRQPAAALWGIFRYSNPVLLLAVLAALLWLVSMAVRRRRELSSSWLTAPGAALGWALVTIPDLLLHLR